MVICFPSSPRMTSHFTRTKQLVSNSSNRNQPELVLLCFSTSPPLYSCSMAPHAAINLHTQAFVLGFALYDAQTKIKITVVTHVPACSQPSSSWGGDSQTLCSLFPEKENELIPCGVDVKRLERNGSSWCSRRGQRISPEPGLLGRGLWEWLCQE